MKPEVRQIRRSLRPFYLLCGWLALGAGVVGIFLPLLPTTPFVLIAAACFSRGSPRIHHWIVNHPRFGPPLKDWEEKRAIRPRAKRLATLLILVSFSFPLIIIELSGGLRAGIAVLMVGLLTFIWTRPSG